MRCGPGPVKVSQRWKEGIQEDVERGGTIEGTEREGTERVLGGSGRVPVRVMRVQRQGHSAIRGARITCASFRKDMQAVNVGMDEAAQQWDMALGQ